MICELNNIGYSNKIFILFKIEQINLLLFHLAVILDNNKIYVEGAKSLAEMLKFNKNLT